MVYPNSQEARELIILDDSEKYVPNILTQHEYIRQKRYHRDLEYRMLNGSLSGAEEDEVASLLKLNMVDEYQVITFYLKPEIQKEIPLDEQFKRIWIIKVVITPIRETKTVYLEGAYIDDAN